jgi:putative transposase
MGKAANPTRRPIVERLFKTLETNGFHRIASTTGSNNKDPKRDNAEQTAVKYKISALQIEELADVIIADYNAKPHMQ